MKYWTVTDIQKVKTMAAHGYSKAEVAERLSRSHDSVRSIAGRYGIVFKMVRTWSDAETQYLRETAGKLPVYAIAAKLDRSQAAIKVRASKLRLSLV